jgi:hypothetical protein
MGFSFRSARCTFIRFQAVAARPYSVVGLNGRVASRPNTSPWTRPERSRWAIRCSRSTDAIGTVRFPARLKRLIETYALTEQQALWLLKNPDRKAGSIDEAASWYAALRDAGNTLDDYDRVRRQLAERAAARAEARRQELVEQARASGRAAG